jgi:hypothetical protein
VSSQSPYDWPENGKWIVRSIEQLSTDFKELESVLSQLKDHLSRQDLDAAKLKWQMGLIGAVAGATMGAIITGLVGLIFAMVLKH